MYIDPVYVTKEQLIVPIAQSSEVEKVDIVEEIAKKLAIYQVVILRSSSEDRFNLSSLKTLLGEEFPYDSHSSEKVHPKAEADKNHFLLTYDPTAISYQIALNSRCSLPLHTDGTTSSSTTPVFIGFCHLSHPQSGGLTRVAGGSRLVHFLARYYPQEFLALCQPNCVISQLADGSRSKEHTIFEIQEGEIFIHYRNDPTRQMLPQPGKDFDRAQKGLEIIDAYLQQESNYIRLNAYANEVIIIPNQAALHGRDEYVDGEGQIRRVQGVMYSGKQADKRLPQGIKPLPGTHLACLVKCLSTLRIEQHSAFNLEPEQFSEIPHWESWANLVCRIPYTCH
jgi:hypothetical protein